MSVEPFLPLTKKRGDRPGKIPWYRSAHIRAFALDEDPAGSHALCIGGSEVAETSPGHVIRCCRAPKSAKPEENSELVDSVNPGPAAWNAKGRLSRSAPFAAPAASLTSDSVQTPGW